MKTLLFVLALAVMNAPVSASAADSEVVAAVHQFIDSFNKGDVPAAEAAHTSSVVIIDEMPPYLWEGPGAFKSWLGDLTKYDQAAGNTGGHMKLGEVIREEVSDDRAYVVMHALYTFQKHAVPMQEAAQMTFALRKEAAGWRIGGWAFAGPTPTPVPK